jgi:hypothetical protein
MFWHWELALFGKRQLRHWGYSTINRLRMTEPDFDIIPSTAPPSPQTRVGYFINKGAGKEVKKGNPPPPKVYMQAVNDSAHLYNVDFPLRSIVRASTAAPTYFPGRSRQTMTLLA